MHRSSCYRLAILACGSLLVCGSGCADSNFTVPSIWKEGDDRAELAKYGPTAGQRIEELQKLAKEASGYSPALQEQMAQDLGRRMQSERNPLVRAELIRTLANYPTQSSRTALTAALKDPDRKVRIACCEACSKLVGTDSVQLLGGVVATDADIDVRLAAVRALGASSDPGAIAAISPALEDSDPALQFLAVQSLRSVSGENLGDDVNAWRQFVQARQQSGQPPASIAQGWRRFF